jgi:hypothetical protein
LAIPDCFHGAAEVPSQEYNELEIVVIKRKGIDDNLYRRIRAYEPFDDDDEFTREFVVHGDGKYAANEVHINIYESHGSLLRPWR